MRTLAVFSAGLLAFSLVACSSSEDGKEGPDPTPTPTAVPTPTSQPTPTPASSAAEFTSEAGGKVSVASGETLDVSAYAIPEENDGSAGAVTFSVETGATAPTPLPTNIDPIGQITKFGPDGFDFAWPLAMTLPIPAEMENFTGLQYMRYDASSGEWVPFPGLTFVTDDSNKVIGASVPAYDLGYDTLGLLNENPAQKYAPYADGTKLGAECDTCSGTMNVIGNSCSPEGSGTGKCHFYLVSKSYTPREEWQRSSFAAFLRTWNGQRGTDRCVWNAATERFEAQDDGNCGMWITGSDPTGWPAAQSLMPISQGDWEFCITKSEYVIPGGSLPIPGKWTHNELHSVSITQASHNTCAVTSCWNNVVEVRMPGPDGWEPPHERTSCPTNSDPTTPVGTGEFQATLTWVNNDSKAADLDLHLYTPDDEHIYYGHDVSNDGLIELDRDWQSESGNAIENIYTVGSGTTLPSGSYRLTVKHFTGSVPISFSVRVIRGGSSTTYNRTVNTEYEEIEILNFTE